MPKKLSIGNTVITRIGFAGVKVEYNKHSICIDPASEVENCSIILYTHSHSRHYTNSPVSSEKRVYSPFTGIIVKPGDVLEVEGIRITVREAYNDPSIHGDIVPHQGVLVLDIFSLLQEAEYILCWRQRPSPRVNTSRIQYRCFNSTHWWRSSNESRRRF